jgi:hypothetical protein
MFDEPNWLITTFIGAVIGLLLPYLVDVTKYLWRYWKSEPLVGQWFEYHANFVGGENHISSGVWKINKGFSHEFTVNFTHNTGGKLEYRGALFEERGHIVAELKSYSHRNESLYYRFMNPIASERVIPGIWLSFERDGRICSGAAILSKEELPMSEVLGTLKTLIESSSKFPALVVKQ